MIIKIDVREGLSSSRRVLYQDFEVRCDDLVSNAIIKNKQKGFSLFEVLIALFILAIGVVGATSLQLAALRTTKHTSIQTAAVQMAVDISERIRLNNPALKSGDEPYAGVDYRFTDGEPAQAAGCYGRSCTMSELARWDVYELKKRLYQEIPSGRVRICRDDMPWNPGAEKLDWTCSGGGDASLVVKIGWPTKTPDGTARSDSTDFPPLVAMTIAVHAPR